MMPILFVIFLILTGCDTTIKTTGQYAPGEYLPQLHIGNTTSLTLSNVIVTSGESVTAIITTKDAKDQPLSQGGAQISLQSSGDGSVMIGSTQDNQNGSYSISIQGIKAGSISFKVIANKVTLSGPSALLTVNPAPLSVEKSDIFISRIDYLVGDTASVYFTPKDLNGNIIDDSTLSLYPTITNGTSTATVDSFIYSQGKYLSSITATGAGTPSQLNISVKNYGIVTSIYPVSVAATRPDYTKSSLTISRTSLRVGQAATINIYVKNASGSVVNIDNMPIILEFYNGSSQVSFSNVTKSGSYYTATVTGSQTGTAGKIRAKVDGEYILTTGEIPSFQVTP